MISLIFKASSRQTSCTFHDRPLFFFLSFFFSSENIKNLFPKGSLSSSTILVLVNAVYFKGQWDKKFNPNDTQQGEFWLDKVLSIFL